MIEKTVAHPSDVNHPVGQKLAEVTLAEVKAEVKIVHSDPELLKRQQLPHFVGISATNTDTKGLLMCLVIIPPGGAAEPHIHPEHETAVYLLQGQVELLYGEGLKQRQICEAGDFIFTPPGVPHQPRNLSATEPVYGLVARTDANEKEQSVPYIL
jgi:uncharacterized RmlC-like cupin family protein